MTEPTTWPARHPALTYTGARLAIFALIFVVLLFVFGNLFVALFSAAIASAIISVFALRKQREALSMSIATRAERANQRMAERAATEDAWDDSQRQTEGSESDSGRL